MSYKIPTNSLILVVLVFFGWALVVQMILLANSFRGEPTDQFFDYSSNRFYENAQAISSMQNHLEDATISSLQRDKSFVESNEYRSMEKFIREHYNIDKLRSDFQNKGYIT